MIIDEQVFRFNTLKEKVQYFMSVFDKKALLLCLDQIKAQQEAPDFWNDTKNAMQVGKKQKDAQSKLDLIKKVETLVGEIEFLIELNDLEGTQEVFDNLNTALNNLELTLEDATISTLLSGKYDDNNAILTLHAGAGGTEAQDWVSMLYRMYTRFCEREGYTIKVLDYLEGDDAGIKSVSFMVSGDKAYGYLKAEKGVHRLVRISPFDANSRRHTSFASLDVMPEITDDEDIVINPDDLKVDTYRSSGAGGQHVNKTESAIRITHIPTGIIVACQTERSQIQNRETAMSMLKSKLIAKREEELSQTLSNIQGELKKIEWGSQIRSYVFCPYTLAKDHRTGYENSNITAVMDGDIKPFILDYLKKSQA